MFKTLKNISSPLLSLAIVMVAVGLFSTYIPLRLTLNGESPYIVGGVTAAYFAGLVIGSVKAERFIAQVGLIRTYAAFASLMTVISIGIGLVIHPLMWIFGRFLMGFFTAGLYIVIESWMLMVAGKDQKGTILAYYMIAFYAAQAGGQFLLGVIPAVSLVPFNITALVIALSVVPVALTKQGSPTIPGRSLLSPLKLLKISPFGILSAFGSGLIMGAFFGLAPVFAYKVGMTSSDVATYMGMTIIGGFILQWPIGRLSDKISRRFVLVAVSFVTSALAILIALASLVSTEILFILSLIFGGFAFTMYPMSISYTNDYLDPKDLVASTGGLLVAYGMGCVFGPLIAPSIMEVIGPFGLYFYFAFIASTIAVFGVVRRNERKPLAVSEQSSFVSVPRTTPVIAEMNPRFEDNKAMGTTFVETVEVKLDTTIPKEVEVITKVDEQTPI